MPIADRVLANGIRLVTEPIVAAQSAAIGFWFYAGSRDELENEAGSTHFVEHLLFKGTARRSASDIARFFDRVGGYVNAFTERECVCLMCVVPPERVDEAVSVLVEMTSESSLEDRDIELERSVILSEILSTQDDADEMGMETAFSLMFPGHPFSRPIAGTADGLRSLEARTLRERYTGAFARGPDFVTAAGAFEEDAIYGSLLAFPSIGGRVINGVPPEFRAGRFAKRFDRRSSFSQAQIYLSFPIDEARTAEAWGTWALINAITGDMVSSRLFQSLREERGLCYSVYSFAQFGRDCAFWMAALSSPPDRAPYAYRSLLEEIGKLAESGVSETEVADAASHIVGEMRLSSDDTEYRMKRLARQLMFSGNAVPTGVTAEILLGIGHDRVSGTIRRAFSPDSMNTVVFGDRQNVKECEKLWK